jgi:hypothetical protein
VYAHGRLVTAVRPTTRRPDVLRSRPSVADERTGYSIDVPRAALGPAGGGDVRLFGIQSGNASPLPFHCAYRLHDFGC